MARTVKCRHIGMDSLIAVDLKNKLQNKLGKPIKNTIFFDFPTITRLANHLKDEIGTEYFEVQIDTGDEFLNSFENELKGFEIKPIEEDHKNTVYN